MSNKEVNLTLSLRSGKVVPRVSDSNATDDTDESVLDPPSDIKNSDLENSEHSNKMSTFNVDQAIKLIPEYDGSPSTLHRFLQIANIQYARATSEVHKNEFLDLIRSKLTDRAYNTILRYNDYETWSALEGALKNQFSHIRSVQVIQKEIFTLRKGHKENVTEYAEKLETLLDELNIASTRDQESVGSSAIRQLNETMAINCFKQGLRHPLKLTAKASKHESLRKAIDFALDEERLLESESEQKSKHTTVRKFCRYCKRSRHDIRECRQIGQSNRHCVATATPQPFPNSVSEVSIESIIVLEKNSVDTAKTGARDQSVPQARAEYSAARFSSKYKCRTW